MVRINTYRIPVVPNQIESKIIINNNNYSACLCGYHYIICIMHKIVKSQMALYVQKNNLKCLIFIVFITIQFL